MNLIPFRPALLPVLALCLAGCLVGKEEIAYDVWAGERLESAHVGVDADGTVRILVQVAMIYGYAGERDPSIDRYQIRNFHTLLYSPKDTAWEKLPFRNLSQNLNYSPLLVPDQDGRLHAGVWDDRKLLLYGPKLGKWDLKTSAALPDRRRGVYRTMPAMGLAGDTAWQVVFSREDIREPRQTMRVEVASSTGIPLLLDSAVNFNFQAFHSGNGRNYAAGFTFSNGEKVASSLDYYRWDLAPKPGRVRKHEVLRSGTLRAAFFARVKGSLVLYAQTEDAVIPFALGEEMDAKLPDLEVQIKPHISKDGRVQYAARVAVDSTGCVHMLMPGSTDFLPTTFLHWKSCGDGGFDTLEVPLPTLDWRINSESPEYALAPDGTFYVALLIGKPAQPVDGRFLQSLYPTRLYLAINRQGRWTYEKVAEYP